MEETLSSTNTSTKQQWIAEQAEKHPERVFTSLHHLIDEEWMLERIVGRGRMVRRASTA